MAAQSEDLEPFVLWRHEGRRLVPQSKRSASEFIPVYLSVKGA